MTFDEDDTSNSTPEEGIMAKVQFRSGQYYHVYNRGVNRGVIFFNQENYAFFIRRMSHYFQPAIVQIIAYCLMPTHHHLLVRMITDDEFASKVMQPFGTSYVKAVNKQQDRVGPLFQGKYKVKLVDSDAYLSSCHPSTGNQIVNAVPSPTSLSTRISPPWAWTMSRAMARPSPMPWGKR